MSSIPSTITSTITRRAFVGALPGIAALPAVVAANPLGQDAQPATPAVHETFPAQDAALVREIVGVSHGNLKRVAELLDLSPALAKASWDWGFGDWESALGAAAHTGNRAIAELLVEHGARPNIFSATMLGQLDVVRAFVAASTDSTPVQRIPGPHSITLLSHARAGGDPARAVYDYLVSLGDADIRPTDEPLSDEAKQGYLGVYVFGERARDRLQVIRMRDGALSLEPEGGAARRLFRVGEHAFHPAGAPAVRIVFAWAGERAAAVTIHDPHPIIVAKRIE